MPLGASGERGGASGMAVGGVVGRLVPNANGRAGDVGDDDAGVPEGEELAAGAAGGTEGEPMGGREGAAPNGGLLPESGAPIGGRGAPNAGPPIGGRGEAGPGPPTGRDPPPRPTPPMRPVPGGPEGAPPREPPNPPCPPNCLGEPYEGPDDPLSPYPRRSSKPPPRRGFRLKGRLEGRDETPPGPRGPNPRWRSASCLAFSARNFLRSFLLSASLTTSSRPLMRRCDRAAIASLPRSGSRNIAIAKPRLLPSSSVASTRSSRSGKLARSILTCSTVVRLSRLPMKILNMPVRAPEMYGGDHKDRQRISNADDGAETHSVAAASGNRFPPVG